MTTNDETVTGPFGPIEGPRPSARAAIQDMLDAGLLDDLMGRIDNGDLQLTGAGGFIPEMIKAVLERGLNAELTNTRSTCPGYPGCGVRPAPRPRTWRPRWSGPRSQAGTPKGEPRTAPGYLIEGNTTKGWKAALGALLIAFPNRLDNHIN